MLDSEVVATLVGEALNSDKFLSRYARIGNTDGFIKRAYNFLRAMVKELKSKGDENNELADIVMPTIKSLDKLLQQNNVADRAEGRKYSTIQKDGKYYNPTEEEIIKKHPTISEVQIIDAKYSPRIKMTKDEYKAYRKQQIQKASKVFGVYTNKDTLYSNEYGQINAEFGNMAIKKGKSYGGVALYDILPHIPRIFENAIVLDTKPDRNSDTNIKGIVDFVGCATLNNKYLAIVKLNVKEYVNDKAKIYDNKVLTIEELTVVERVGHQDAEASSDSTSSAVSSKYIIARFRELVKENQEKNSGNQEKNSGKGQELNIEFENPPQHTSETSLDSNATTKIIHQNELTINTSEKKYSLTPKDTKSGADDAKKARKLREQMAREAAENARSEHANVCERGIEYGEKLDHVYDNACDSECNVCKKQTRSHVFHVDANGDKLCDNCSAAVDHATAAESSALAPKLSDVAISGICTAGAVGVAAGGFSIVWFAIKKKTWAELLKLFIK